jgi:hypothetical protein
MKKHKAKPHQNFPRTATPLQEIAEGSCPAPALSTHHPQCIFWTLLRLDHTWVAEAIALSPFACGPSVMDMATGKSNENKMNFLLMSCVSACG